MESIKQLLIELKDKKLKQLAHYEEQKRELFDLQVKLNKQITQEKKFLNELHDLLRELKGDRSDTINFMESDLFKIMCEEMREFLK